jgi:Zn finger protein HypA/HybF involved in hydrogenase expression
LFSKKEAERLLNERERLKFYCENCKNVWTQWKPEGYVVRSGDNTNFFIHIGEPDDSIRTYIQCPECKGTKKIRRMNVVKISSHPQKRIHPIIRKDDFSDTVMGNSETMIF